MICIKNESNKLLNDINTKLGNTDISSIGGVNY